MNVSFTVSVTAQPPEAARAVSVPVVGKHETAAVCARALGACDASINTVNAASSNRAAGERRHAAR